MNIETATIAVIFGVAMLLAVPLGRAFKVDLGHNRFTHLDGLRAVAALMVVCSHYIVYAGLITNSPVDTRLTDALGAVGVQIFFGITGFLFTRKTLSGRIDVEALISSRVRRIVPMYLVAMTAAIAAALYVLDAAHKPIELHVVDLLRVYAYGFIAGQLPSISGLSIAGQAGQMWTLAWEWSFYLLVPVLGALLERPSRATIGFVAMVLIALAGEYGGSLPVWTFFLPGIICALLEKRIKPSERMQMMLTTVGAALIAVALLVRMPLYGFAQIALMLAAFPALLFGHHEPLSLRPLRLLGEVSYSVYLLHLTLASLFITYIHSDSAYLQYQTPIERLPLAMATVIGLFFLSFATYALIERPFMRAGEKKPTTPRTPPLPDTDRVNVSAARHRAGSEL